MWLPSEAFPPSFSFPLLMTTRKISEMDKACDAISCNINLWVWAEARGVCTEGSRWMWGWVGVVMVKECWVRVEQPGCSAGSPKSIWSVTLTATRKAVYTWPWPYVYTQPSVRSVRLADRTAAAERGRGGASNPSRRDLFVELGHNWPARSQLVSQCSCGCYEI